MDSNYKTVITVQTEIDANIALIWKCWMNPYDILKWNSASEDWHTTKAENHLHVGGRFCYRMEAKDGSVGFDFSGTYDSVVTYKEIEYTMDDGRKASIVFSAENGKVVITEKFEAESINPVEMQQEGWQSILNNFKKHVESQ